MRIGVHKVLMNSPSDVSGLDKLIESGTVDAQEIVALIGKTEGNGGANDFTRGFATLCAFTHQPSHFVKMGFTIVPHMWVPEKIAHDCTACPLFRRCGQYAVTLPLRAGVRIRPEQPAAVIYGGRSVAQRRPNVERLQLAPSHEERVVADAVPA